MASIITVTFNSIPAADTVLQLADTLLLANDDHLDEIFKALRTQVGEATAITDNNVSAGFYKKAINIDYNATNLYTITVVSNVVTITANNPLSQFAETSNTTAGAVTVVINNDPFTAAITIDSVTVSEADSSPCDNVKLTVTVSEQADNINTPISQAVATNPFVFDTIRVDSVDVTMEKDSDLATQLLRIPKLLSTYIDIDIVNTPSGATVSAVRQFPLSDLAIVGVIFPLTFEYSLDNVLWQASNSWSGLAEGSHTLYVRDNIGCSISIPFTISEFTPNLVDYEPIFEISNLNSIRYKENVVWSDAIPKNVNNTLSFEEATKINQRSFVQPFQKNDPIQNTQLRSSYQTNTAVLIDSDGNETTLTGVKVTDNMDKTDVRDAFVVNFVGGANIGRLGVYFGAGDVYNPITLVYESSYNLNGELMTWVNIGDYINLQGIGWVLIEDIVPIPDNIPYSGKCLVLNALAGDYSLGDQSTIQATTVYNILDFERYEFPVDFTSLEGYYKVKINGTDTRTNFLDREKLSEWLDIKETHCKMYVIDYYNSENNEINFSSGIQYRIRIPIARDLKRTPENNQDNYVTDTNTVKLESSIRKFYDFSAYPLPEGMADVLEMVLSQDRLFMNGLSYLSEGDIGMNALGDTNLVQVKAQLVQSDYKFVSTSGLGVGETVFTPAVPLEIDPSAPGLLFLD